MVRSFAKQHFVIKGLAVQLDVHAPHDGEAESERSNWHAHLLITTRRLEGDRFGIKKARDLDRRCGEPADGRSSRMAKLGANYGGTIRTATSASTGSI